MDNPQLSIPIPTQSCKKEIESHFFSQANCKWNNEPKCQIAKAIWPEYNKNRSKDLIRTDRNSIRKVVMLITGHSILGKQGQRLGIPASYLCKYSEDEDVELSMTHLLTTCASLARLRHRTLGEPYFENLTELGSIDIGRINRFSKHVQLEQFTTPDN